MGANVFHVGQADGGERISPAVPVERAEQGVHACLSTLEDAGEGEGLPKDRFSPRLLLPCPCLDVIAAALAHPSSLNPTVDPGTLLPCSRAEAAHRALQLLQRSCHEQEGSEDVLCYCCYLPLSLPIREMHLHRHCPAASPRKDWRTTACICPPESRTSDPGGAARLLGSHILNAQSSGAQAQSPG